MKTKCGHRVVFGDIQSLMTNGILIELTDEPTIVVVVVSKSMMNHHYGINIEYDCFHITRYENRLSNGASLKLKRLFGELKDIFDEEIKINNKADGIERD